MPHTQKIPTFPFFFAPETLRKTTEKKGTDRRFAPFVLEMKYSNYKQSVCVCVCVYAIKLSAAIR